MTERLLKKVNSFLEPPTPTRVVRLQPDLINLCNQEINCEAHYYSKSLNSNGKEIYFLKEYFIVYNCIGWALGIRDWINPPAQKCNYNKNDSIDCLLKLTQKHLNAVLIQYSQDYRGRNFIQEDVISKLKTVYCSYSLANADLINKDGAVAFYFKNGAITHAARFVYKLEGHIINSWISKLGHDIMIAHNLEDLAGIDSLYGDPLCYAIPLNYQNGCIVGEDAECIAQNN